MTTAGSKLSKREQAVSRLHAADSRWQADRLPSLGSAAPKQKATSCERVGVTFRRKVGHYPGKEPRLGQPARHSGRGESQSKRKSLRLLHS